MFQANLSSPSTTILAIATVTSEQPAEHLCWGSTTDSKGIARMQPLIATACMTSYS